MDDITALLKGKNREVAEMAKKVMKKLEEEEVEKKSFTLSVTENSKERARWLRRVVPWRTSCVTSVEKKE